MTAVILLSGCGGGASSFLQPPPPPEPDFEISVSAMSVSVAQGGTTPPLTIAIKAKNGFNGTVQIVLAGLPNGVVSNPASPFSVPAGDSVAVVFGASADVGTGNFTLSAQGTSGALSHSVSFALTVQTATAPALSRSSFARTDAIPALDEPAGEPQHRHMAYDPGSKRVFIANRAMNRVEVFSSLDQSRVSEIATPAATSVDISPDAMLIWVGTLTQQAAAIDTSSLHVKARVTIPSLSPIPGSVFDRPEELLSLANGKLMLRLRQSAGAESLLALWDPLTNAITNLTPAAPQLFQAGLGTMARSGDHTKLLVAANDSSGDVAIFDDSGNILAGPRSLGSGVIPLVAGGPDGSRFALALVSGGAWQLILVDGALNQLTSISTAAIRALLFSRDGKRLYVTQALPAQPIIAVFDASTLNAMGYVPDLAIQGLATQIEEADETQLLFGISNRGMGFIDAANPTALPSNAPAFAPAPAAQPSEGPSIGGTTVTLAGQNFAASAQLKFGAQLASSVSVIGGTQIQATSPPSVVNGAVNLAAYFPNGWLALAPDAFSYGPQILRVLPNAGAKTGGDTVRICGYGFGVDATKIAVKIGAAVAIIQSVTNLTGIAASLGLDSTYPFPIECIMLQAPAGAPGKATIELSSPSGTVMAANAFQYLQNVPTYSKAGLYKFLLYDQGRQWLYLSATDHLDVFDLNSATFHANPLFPPGGPPQNAGLRGLSLTPDGTQLIVADFGAQKVYLLNPATGIGTSVATGGVAGFSASGPARVAATSTQTVFVSMSGEGTSTGACTSCLSQLNLTASPISIQPAPQPEVTSLTGAPLVQGNATGDHVFLAYDSVPGGPVGFWAAASPNQFTVSSASESAIDLAGAPDGTRFLTRTSASTEVRSADLTLIGAPAVAELEQVPNRVFAPGAALHSSGALIYQPFLTGPPPVAPPVTGIQGGIDIFDAHSGALRLRVLLPEPFAMLAGDTDGLHGSFLAVDENGQRIFAITNSGVTVAQLANVPLGIGAVTPTSGASAGGSTLTIRGSGFQQGTSVTIGGKAASVVFKDMNTLIVTTPALSVGAQQIILTNPDGESVALDAAFMAN